MNTPASADQVNHSLRLNIKATIRAHSPFVSDDVLRRVAMAEVMLWLDSQDESIRAERVVAAAREALRFIDKELSHEEPSTGPRISCGTQPRGV